MRRWLPPPPRTSPLTDDERAVALRCYRTMRLIRSFELRVNELFLRGLIPGTIHLSHGQEASTVGACLRLRPDDVVTMTHRAHGQALAKGVSTRRLMAELLGRATGCSGGKGGSLHVGDMTVGALTSIAIVAAGVPIASGFAFAFKRAGSDRVAMAFIGDGAANKGELHEAMNLAAAWSLPLVILCENNFYASTTNLGAVMRNDTIAERAAAYRMPGVTVDGNDPFEVDRAVRVAVERARAGGGPTFVECLTYRHGGHKRDDPGSYRPAEEVAAWKQRDPIPSFRERLRESAFPEGEIAAIDTSVGAEIEDAVDFAMASPYPAAEMAVTNVYC
jgi:pyruvate dehydrogenase E1 component alpha subunit